MEQLIGIGCFGALGLMCLVFAEKQPKVVRIPIQHNDTEQFSGSLAELKERQERLRNGS